MANPIIMLDGSFLFVTAQVRSHAWSVRHLEGDLVVIIIVGMVVRAEGINFIKLTIMIHTLTTMMVTVPLTLTIQIMTRPLLN
jgi:hypothetical protein